MLTDPTSAVNLELTNSLQAGGPAGAQAKKATLYGVLNQTSTAMGGNYRRRHMEGLGQGRPHSCVRVDRNAVRCAARLLRTTILQPSTGMIKNAPSG